MTTQLGVFKRNVLESDAQEKVAERLQANLATLIDLALNLKQAHWNVVGPNFRSLHLQLDEIIVSVRAATDEIAERIVTLGHVPDGRAGTIQVTSRLSGFPAGMLTVPDMVSEVADQLKAAIDETRSAIHSLGEWDPVSEDLLIGISSQLEKHLWMVQAQEVDNI